MLRTISLGAGVQSSTMALMFTHGELEPMPDCAIFADTGAEPRAVYEWLDWLERRLAFPVHRVMWQRGLLENIVESLEGGRFASAPFYTEPSEDRISTVTTCPTCWGGEAPDCFTCEGSGTITTLETAREGQLRRQCTREFKVQPITRKLRELVGLEPGQRAPRGAQLVTQYIGISLDESQRMKPSRSPWIRHEWPLIEKRMTRAMCLQWMELHGYPRPPRSACTFCPYHSDEEWLHLKTEHPDAWRSAVKIDEMVRAGVRGTTQQLYLHRTLKPIDEIDFEALAKDEQPDLFGNECEGMCGL